MVPLHALRLFMACPSLIMYVVVLQTILTADVGDGHRAGVHSLTVLGQYMFSGDRAGTLKVIQTRQPGVANVADVGI